MIFFHNKARLLQFLCGSATASFVSDGKLRNVGSARCIVIIRIAADAQKIFNEADEKAQKTGEIFDHILNSLTHETVPPYVLFFFIVSHHGIFCKCFAKISETASFAGFAGFATKRGENQSIAEEIGGEIMTAAQILLIMLAGALVVSCFGR